MKKIISASRRTDIPKFHYDWLQQVLRNGEAAVANPRFRDRVYRVDVRPEAVHTLVLWSKDFSNVLKAPMNLENYNLYFQYTINNYSQVLEPNVPEYSYSIRILEGLLQRYDPVQFNIRFDPVILANCGEPWPGGGHPETARLNAFERLCRDLRSLGMNDCRLTTSYIALYPHVKRRLDNAGIHVLMPDDSRVISLFEQFVGIAEKYDLRVFSCASPLLEKVCGLTKGACIDGALLEQIFGGKVSKAKDAGQRKACGCHRSSDLGDYLKQCNFNCLYCYSNH
ncbi:hypothetical protein SCACP_39920 [Sporomusa carbonis]|uniref:DUF1848 family protein n=1 Tax=Sporomusa carbonis TaxID=3076075 RepID=UPI003A78C22E